jgi:phosphate transport system substrate-binding protein
MSKTFKRSLALKAGVALSAIGLIVGGSTTSNAAGVTLTASGSTAIKNLLDVCIPAYAADFGNNVSYGAGGSGAGRNNFRDNTVDLAFSDATYASTDAQPTGKFTYVPATQFPLAILVKLDGYKGNLQLSPSTIAKIFKGTITKWNDAAIVADNTVVNAKTKKKTVAKLPATDITVVYRSDRSGSTGILTGWFAATAASVWAAPAKSDQTFTTAFGGTVPAGTFQGQSGSDGVANGVAAKDGSIGYAETSYGTERASKGVKIVSVQNNAGEYVYPSAAATAKFMNSFTAGDNGAISVDYTNKAKGAYTISGYTYALVYTAAAQKNIGTQAVVKQFLTYLVGDCASENAVKYGYAPLTGGLLTLAKNQIAKID